MRGPFDIILLFLKGSPMAHVRSSAPGVLAMFRLIGFNPASHIAERGAHKAEVRCARYPDKVLYLTTEGLSLAEHLHKEWAICKDWNIARTI